MRFAYQVTAFLALSALSLIVVRRDEQSTNTNDESTVTAAQEQQYGYGGSSFHQSGFGGIRNIGHMDGAKRYRHRRRLSDSNVIIPLSAVEHAIPSLGRENIENLHGHYVHDEHQSPYASFLYDRPKEALENEQKEYLQKMEQVRNEWGAWNFKDEFTTIRPIANFNKTPYKDMKNSEFPEKSWQMDEKYCRDLIDEGRKLVGRIREGIYAEYGHATKDLSTEEQIMERDELFQVHVTDEDPSHSRQPGVAWITMKGFNMLSRKLLHSMITNDEFYYVMGGHSAAAGHGNNAPQQYTMQFANIMEPVFHKLGMRLIARNMAMGGLGTVHFSLGGATLYGETDFLMWDSSMTEKVRGDKDLFNKQGLLGGERVPILFGAGTFNLEDETGNNLWYGDRMKGNGIMPITESLEQVETLPYATRYQSCEKTVKDLCSANKYHDACWEPRSDFEPNVTQDEHAGSQVSWHPGDRAHQFNSRKTILLFLDALTHAFKMWEDGLNKDGSPLKESYWHVGDEYKKVRDHLTSYLNGDGLGTSECEKRWSKFSHGMDKVCRISMSGMTEFTPVNLGSLNSIATYVKSAPNGYNPGRKRTEPAYTGINILPLKWKLPSDQIDLHAIAIATTYEPPELDHSIWHNDGDEDEDEDAEDSRRMLRMEVPGTSGSTNNEPETRLLNAITPGLGWQRNNGAMEVTGYCDGSPMSSTCKRFPTNTCFLYANNDGHGSFQGNGLSGWLVIKIPKVKQGLIFAKIWWWAPRGDAIEVTRGWTEVNNGEGRRRLVKDWPEDFEVDVAVNGNIVKTYNYTQFKVFAQEVAHNEAFYPLVDDENLVPGNEAKEVELGLRIRSESNPLDASFGLTHIYYA